VASRFAAMIAEARIARVVSFAALALLAACGGERRTSQTTAPSGGTSTADSRPVSIKGSDTMVILTQRLAEEYMKSNRGTVIQVNGGGSGTGIAALINGTTDIAQASRPMTEDERTKARTNRGAEIVEVPVALDSLAVFVHGSNPVQTLTIAQIADIYSGKTKSWSAVGGPNAPIVMYGRESSSGTYDYFREHVLNKGDFAPAVQTLQGTAAIINAVGRDRNGIGYGGIAYAKDVRAIAIKTNDGAAGVAPSAASVAGGTYPLSRKLFFYHPANAAERVTKFVRWALTPEAQGLVENVGYFPLTTQR
jgi:phosphate transport system substrate-binding protein